MWESMCNSTIAWNPPRFTVADHVGSTRSQYRRFGLNCRLAPRRSRIDQADRREPLLCSAISWAPRRCLPDSIPNGMPRPHLQGAKATSQSRAFASPTKPLARQSVVSVLTTGSSLVRLTSVAFCLVIFGISTGADVRTPAASNRLQQARSSRFARPVGLCVPKTSSVSA
jgi:hypothetical protein